MVLSEMKRKSLFEKDRTLSKTSDNLFVKFLMLIQYNCLKAWRSRFVSFSNCHMLLPSTLLISRSPLFLICITPITKHFSRLISSKKDDFHIIFNKATPENLISNARHDLYVLHYMKHIILLCLEGFCNEEKLMFDFLYAKSSFSVHTLNFWKAYFFIMCWFVLHYFWAAIMSYFLLHMWHSTEFWYLLSCTCFLVRAS